MLTGVEQAAVYLQKLEADRLAAIAASEEKAHEAKLIKARQEGFQEAMKLLGVERLPRSTKTKRNEIRRAKRRNIPELILTELSFSGAAMTAKQIAGAIDYFTDRTESVLRRLENSRQLVRDQDGRWAIPVTTVPQPDNGRVARANGKSFIRNGGHERATQ
ncbi:MAG: hypothetical protein WA633_18385 [Stellaceae bacterium]